MSVLDISNVLSTVTANINGTVQEETQLNQDFDDFLSLLTTQLQNQDPLEPTDTTEFTNQLVAFSQVEQQISTNSKLEDLLSLSAFSSNAIGVGFIGMNVEATGDQMLFDGSNPAEFGYELSGASSQTVLTISDQQGNILFNTTGGERGVGKHTYSWNGKDINGDTAPAGYYTVSVAAASEDGSNLTTSTSVSNFVHGVETGSNNEIILLAGEEKINIADVEKVYAPAPAPIEDDSEESGI